MRITATAADPAAVKKGIKIATDRETGPSTEPMGGPLLAIEARYQERQKMFHRNRDIGEASPNNRLLTPGQQSAFSKSSDNLVVKHL
jgi:hypothetical protein